MIEDILRITEGIRKQIESNIPLVNDELNRIIESRDTSTKRIEQLLDILLDYMYLGIGKPQFKRLNSYYALFNKKNADVYDRFYQELIED